MLPGPPETRISRQSSLMDGAGKEKQDKQERTQVVVGLGMASVMHSTARMQEVSADSPDCMTLPRESRDCHKRTCGTLKPYVLLS